MRNCDTKVIGYFAYLTKMQVVCTEGKACLIAGSERTIKEYINEINPDHANEHTIKKTRFGEIKQGLLLGAAYAFDKESYGRFYPLAQKEGLNVQEADFDYQKKKGNRFFLVQFKEKTL